jgi:hypothetical protein
MLSEEKLFALGQKVGKAQEVKLLEEDGIVNQHIWHLN